MNCFVVHSDCNIFLLSICWLKSTKNTWINKSWQNIWTSIYLNWLRRTNYKIIVINDFCFKSRHNLSFITSSRDKIRKFRVVVELYFTIFDELISCLMYNQRKLVRMISLFLCANEKLSASTVESISLKQRIMFINGSKNYNAHGLIFHLYSLSVKNSSSPLWAINAKI